MQRYSTPQRHPFPWHVRPTRTLSQSSAMMDFPPSVSTNSGLSPTHDQIRRGKPSHASARMTRSFVFRMQSLPGCTSLEDVSDVCRRSRRHSPTSCCRNPCYLSCTLVYVPSRLKSILESKQGHPASIGERVAHVEIQRLTNTQLSRPTPLPARPARLVVSPRLGPGLREASSDFLCH